MLTSAETEILNLNFPDGNVAAAIRLVEFQPLDSNGFRLEVEG